ncbi:radical SAM protein [Pseudenhygromyxa sp. WMMC2535]|uniref:radical SAM protein n=1 Tax=Pseudenhygromyxa sp. WMMC2535 TaxID=2712867 RepID=UPI00155232C7|nr:radical SAM protein [Pseudenhygromyxa sp. WMMC2535]NVB43352.1 radical SAM protein [Pseudenhygromyxa sp. WMMC2535]
MEPKERFEIQLSHVCNNRCVFCVSGQMTELRMAKPTPLPEVLARFDEAAARGITKVTILGGEPTIHPTFFPTLDHALKLGFETIEIFTNGTRLDKQDFIDRVMARGRDKFHWRISIQGWDAATHDATTKKPGAFAKIVTGLERLAALGQPISCNMCVVEQNYRSLTELPAFVTRYAIDQVHLDMVRPRDAGTRSDDELDGMLPDYAALAEVMRAMFETLERVAPGFDLDVGNLPYCQLPEWAQHVHHGGNTTYTVSADGPGKLSVVAWDKYEDKRSDKQKLESCDSCVFERRCDGFVELYAQRRGTAQFLPVSREKLRRIDPDQRTFVHQLDAALVAMVRERFAGWHLHAADDSEHDRWARQTWVHRDGGRATLLFVPAEPEDGQGGDAEHRDFCLRLEAWSGVDEDRLVALIEGVFERVAARLEPPGSDERPARTRVAPTRARLRARRSWRAEPAQLGPAVRAGLARVLSQQPIAAAWRVAKTHAHASEAGVSVDFVGPGGERSTLHLLGSGNALRGRWDFGRGGEASKRALAMAIGRLLRPGPDAEDPKRAAAR